MNYYLIANNPEITNEVFHKISPIQESDIIVTFNHCWPLQNLSINHKNLYHFSRRSFNRKIPYSGLYVVDQMKSRFSKIFLYPHPESIGQNKRSSVIEHIADKTSLSIQEIEHMHGFAKNHVTIEARKFLSQRHNKVSNMSMGLIGYLFLKQTKSPDDSIYLIGFTHKMNRNKHNADGEREFFTKEQEDGLCYLIN